MKILSRTIAIVVLASAPQLLGAQAAHRWEFEGIAVADTTSRCINKPLTRAGYTWLDRADDAAFRDLFKATEDSLEKSFGPVTITRQVVSEGQPFLMAIVRLHINCSTWNGPPELVSSYRFVTGADSAGIVRKLDEDVRDSMLHDLKGYDIMDWIKIQVRDWGAKPGGKSPRQLTKPTPVGVRG